LRFGRPGLHQLSETEERRWYGKTAQQRQCGQQTAMGYFCMWFELRQMHASRRWQMQGLQGILRTPLVSGLHLSALCEQKGISLLF
jgi:hypothetical protein